MSVPDFTRTQALQTRSDVSADFLGRNPNSINNSCKVFVTFEVVDVLNIFSDDIYDIFSKSPNLTLKEHLHNLQKSLGHSLAGFLPLLTFLVGVCIRVFFTVISMHCLPHHFVCRLLIALSARVI